MDEKEQQEFIAWLSDQLQPANQEDFQQKVQELGEDGLRQAHLQFKKNKIKQYKDGGVLERLAELREFKKQIELKQLGGKVVTPAYTSALGQTVTDKDLLAYRKQGMDFGTREAMGKWLDTWGNNKELPQPLQPQKPTPPKMISRFNQNLMAQEQVPVSQIMREPNSMTVGTAGAFSKWDLGQFKKHVTPLDTVGQPIAIRQRIQEAWNKLNMKFKEGGKIEK